MHKAINVLILFSNLNSKQIFRPIQGVVYFFIVAFVFSTASFADFSGRYCELEGAKTSSGERVSGECYFYSDRYGELEGAKTSSGEKVRGECYRYSGSYAELDGAKTVGGERVRGECYIY